MPSKEEILAAEKKVRVEKPTETKLLIQIDYNRHVILPFKEGLAFMATLEKAEVYVERYTKPPEIRPIEKGDRFTVTPLSQATYTEMKVAMLLGLTVDELREAKNQPEEIPF